MKRASFVYFARPVGQSSPVKIGYSEFPLERLQALMEWAPVPLEIAATAPGDFKLERRLHGVFAGSHSHREWFYASKALNGLIKGLSEGIALAELIDLDAPLLPFRKAKRKPLTEDRSRYLSYSARIRNAFRRIPKHWCPPDVDEILDCWRDATTLSNYLHRADKRSPSASDMIRLDEVLSNPVAHAQTQEERFPKPRAVA